LWVNYYDISGFRTGFGDYVTCQKGTKFTAMWMLWSRFSDILSGYDHVLFLDDDVSCSTQDLNDLFAMCREENLALSQMSLSPESSTNWTELYQKKTTKRSRDVSAVEIMMPVFSRAALVELSSTFDASTSGFGLDLVWGHLIRRLGWRVAVVDGVVATHARPVDQANGAFYSYLRKLGINPKAELWQLLLDYGAEKDLIGAV
jgi:hypothetical protein